MPTRRQQRLNGLLFEELLLLIPGRLDDPRLTDTRVTRVETTNDMAVAKVYVTAATDDDDAVKQMLLALEHAQGRLRAELGALGLRRLPRLVFARDRQYESGERVLALLDHLADEGGPDDQSPAAGESPAADTGPTDSPARSDQGA